MLHLHKILVPTELSPSTHGALALAETLAERAGGELHVLHVAHTAKEGPLGSLLDAFADVPASPLQREEALLARLDEELRVLHDDPQQVRRAVRFGKVTTEIEAYARAENIGLIVMGTRGHRGLQHAIGGTAGHVLRHAPCPVMTTHTQGGPSGDVYPFRHILVPVDFSPKSKEAVRAARRLGGLFEAAVSLLFVAEERTVPIFNDTGLPTLMTVHLDPDIVLRAPEALAELYHEVGGPAVRAAYHVQDGHPAEEILAFASTHDVDLVVMGSAAEAAPERVTLGSLTERVVRRAPCPVLTLRPVDAEEG